MSNNKKIMPAKSKKPNIKNEVMARIVKGEIVMKSKWYFVVGSVLTGAGLVGLSMGTIFLVNLTLFLVRKRGYGMGRLELMLVDFPWWVPILAVAGIIAGLWLMKKYDFSYKKNFWVIIIGFVTAIIIAAWLIDVLGINETWARRGSMQKFYQHLERGENGFQRGSGWRKKQWE